jgi:hypothetical protein
MNVGDRVLLRNHPDWPARKVTYMPSPNYVHCAIHRYDEITGPASDFAVVPASFKDAPVRPRRAIDEYPYAPEELREAARQEDRKPENLRRWLAYWRAYDTWAIDELAKVDIDLSKRWSAMSYQMIIDTLTLLRLAGVDTTDL